MPFFGQKDAAQSAIIRRMVRDLNISGADRDRTDRARAGRVGPELAQCLSGRVQADSPLWCCIVHSWWCKTDSIEGNTRCRR